MILYNGATGGLGRHLGAALAKTNAPYRALSARLEDQRALLRELDDLDPAADVTFLHLAARVSVPACEADPAEARRINVTLAESVVSTVLDWAARRRLGIRVIYVSTGHVYEAQPPGSRLAETDATRPRSTYARTKLEAEEQLTHLTSAREVPLLIARVFGLLAPQQAPNYVLPGLIRRVRAGDLVGIPGLEAARDYLDARDVCEGLTLLAKTEWPASPLVVNICSGVPVTIRDLLGEVLRAHDPESANQLTRSARPAQGRADDIPWLVGDPSRFVGLTGAPAQRISLSASVTDALIFSGSS